MTSDVGNLFHAPFPKRQNVLGTLVCVLPAAQSIIFRGCLGTQTLSWKLSCQHAGIAPMTSTTTSLPACGHHSAYPAHHWCLLFPRPHSWRPARHPRRYGAIQPPAPQHPAGGDWEHMGRPTRGCIGLQGTVSCRAIPSAHVTSMAQHHHQDRQSYICWICPDGACNMLVQVICQLACTQGRRWRLRCCAAHSSQTTSSRHRHGMAPRPGPWRTPGCCRRAPPRGSPGRPAALCWIATR